MSPASALSPPPERRPEHRLLAPAWRQKQQQQQQQGEGEAVSSSSSSPATITTGNGNTTIAEVPYRVEDVGGQQVVDEYDVTVGTMTTGDETYRHFRTSHDSASDDEDDYECEEYEGAENYQTLSKITTHVADWTLHTAAAAAAANNTTTTTTHYEQHQRNISNSNEDDDYGVTKSQEVDESSTDVDDYHDEIESVATNEFNNNNKNKGDGHEEDTFIHIITNEQQISLHPPPITVPLVLVDLVALTGCMPTTMSSKAILVTQLMESLLGSSSSSTSSSASNSSSVSSDDDNNKNIHNYNDDNNKNMGDGLSLQFNERVNELFESGVAYHIDHHMILSNIVAMLL